MSEEEQIISDLITLFEIWRCSFFKKIGLVWEIDPPAVLKGKEYLTRKPK